ncbi:saccharopine dehydrogenase [Alkalilimnicola ehrlichii]|uniref:Saccharopine dehydrogenase n=1 Tax=Alkalilimnicola ehrlichii TaxID=351052 RepID=A0A3E0WXR1_9GAMM|nr:NAD(P)-dependent oxidoreductase [Alkalilimnicola ehrlichii]RFA29293.1 saccharopine dehydrogenase [Alkalilimnicola ehrlichii]RFA36806.1 saccharopine dehydrogenase [Alkalilimnicola ehrlichii]
MYATPSPSVLIVGGSGIVGSQAAAALRRLQPELPITIGGRTLAKAEAIAEQLGNADATVVDLNRADLGQSADAAYSAVAMFLKDDGLNSLRFAQQQRIPYLGISSAAFEIGPEVSHFIHRPTDSAILMLSNWLAGTATLGTLYFARDFEHIDTISVAALLDEQDLGGPSAHADYVRQTQAAPRPLILKGGQWTWAGDEEATRVFSSVDGTAVHGQALANLDPLSLANATGAQSVRFDFALGETASRRRGEPFSTEIVIEIGGRLREGDNAQARYEIVHPAGQAPMTAVGVAVGIECLLGLNGGSAVPAGLYLPEVLISPDYMVEKLRQSGAVLRRAQ